MGMGSTTTGTTQENFSPEQIAAQYLGVKTLEENEPLQNMQIRARLALFNPTEVNAPLREGIMASTRGAGGIARQSIARGLADAGIPSTMSAPLLSRLEDIDRENMNAQARRIGERFLTGPSLQLYHPQLAQYIARPSSVEQTSSTSQGEGAMAMQAAGLAIGIGTAIVI